ncbi:MAG: DUF2851 family protein [Candidatus Marinimicrobia bacterium]|nr:DUF2851 family protein [Candidatus Neomarinimicrobiota bacterium]
MYTIMDVAGGNHIAEPTNFHWRDLEENLVNWWLQQSITRSDLMTADGEHLIVLDPGHLNDGAGPDILDCHLILDDRELAGPVEMHRRSKDWFGHKHHQDPHYQDVILHVVEEDQGGPDLPTLILPNQKGSKSFCLAERCVSQAELVQFAENRFRRKMNHLKALGSIDSDYDPLLLGLYEIILAGPHRHRSLQELALRLGLAAWPDSKVWQGSRQAYPGSGPSLQLLDRLIKNADLFEPLQRCLLKPAGWREWDTILSPLFSLGISRSQGREWVVNILAPHYGFDEGLGLWLRMTPFRHYGFEKWVCRNLGVTCAKTIAEQQALLEWRELLCVPGNCQACPLTHQTLAWFD